MKIQKYLIELKELMRQAGYEQSAWFESKVEEFLNTIYEDGFKVGFNDCKRMVEEGEHLHCCVIPNSKKASPNNIEVKQKNECCCHSDTGHLKREHKKGEHMIECSYCTLMSNAEDKDPSF